MSLGADAEDARDRAGLLDDGDHAPTGLDPGRGAGRRRTARRPGPCPCPGTIYGWGLYEDAEIGIIQADAAELSFTSRFVSTLARRASGAREGGGG